MSRLMASIIKQAGIFTLYILCLFTTQSFLWENVCVGADYINVYAPLVEPFSVDWKILQHCILVGTGIPQLLSFKIFARKIPVISGKYGSYWCD